MACVIIYFDRIFISDLCKCYLGPQLCCAIGSVDSFRNNYSDKVQQCANAISANTIDQYQCPSSNSPEPTNKLALVQAQLGCAVGMLISCGVYVVVYLFACFGVCFGHD